MTTTKVSTAERAPVPVDVGLLIDGRHRAGDRVEVTNPAAPSEVVGSYVVADAAAVDAAVLAATAAARPWAGRDAGERGDLLGRAAERLRTRTDDLAVLLSREHGKTVTEAAAEITGAAHILAWHADQSAALDAVTVDDERGRVIHLRVAMGVVAIIVPWNFPVLLAQLMVAPALLAGNTVIVKLPDNSPLTLALVLVDLAADLPSGVLNIVSGPGSVGQQLTTHPGIAKIAFTGSTPTGRAIMRAASESIKNLSLELGGNDAAIVLSDATIDEALIDGLVAGSLNNAGQVCYAPKRIYVHESHLEAFRAAFVRRASAIVVGNGTDPITTMGPVNNAQQLRVVESLQADAERRGATLTPLGTHAPGLDPDGLFFQPCLITDIDNAAAVVQDEQFGPLVPVVSYADENQAIEMANDTTFGLAASVWSDDADHAFDVARQLQAGTVFVNVHQVGASRVDMPFGGFKQSGIGRGHGLEGIYEYTELQVLAQREDMRSAHQ